MQVMSDVCRQLCRGELREVEARHRLDLSEAEYLQIVRDKTASLIGGCCRIGALLGGGDANTVERLTAFGVSFGLAFQIIDDCLDLAGDQRELGKSILSDLDKGTLSLPIIYLAQALSAADRRRLFRPLQARTGFAGGRSIAPALLRRIAASARACGAIERATERARTLIRNAHEALAPVALNGLKDSYRQLAAYAVSRRR
jgi:octaprenyl-diphosphate synthase